jgi:hypothetical protein
LLAPFVVGGWSMTRPWGIVLAALYLGYLWMVVA